MKYCSSLVFLLFFFSLNGSSQKAKNDLLFAGTPKSFTILTIQTGDSIAFVLQHSDSWKTEKITGISKDSVFFAGEMTRLTDIKEIKSSGNRFSQVYYPGAGQVSVPPASVYASPKETEAFRDKLSNEMGFHGTFETEKTGVYRQNRLNRRLYLEYIPTHQIFGVGEKQAVVYKTSDHPKRAIGVIRQIASDSILFDTLTLRFHDFTTLNDTSIRSYGRTFGKPPKIRSDIHYKKADSLNWNIIVPPVSIYHDQFSFNSYENFLIHSVRTKKFAKDNDPLIFRNFVKINLAKIFHIELAFSYERLLVNRISLEVEAGYMLGVKTTFVPLSKPFDLAFYRYDGFSILVNPRYYFSANRAYVGPVVLFNNLWFDGVPTSFGFKDGDSHYQDQKRNDFGLSIRIGGMKRYSHLVIDYYFGLGIKCVLLQIKDYGYSSQTSDYVNWYNPGHTPMDKNKTLLEPIINAGIKIGGAF